MITRSAYLSRRILRLSQQRQNAPNLHRILALTVAQAHLQEHVRARVAPSFTDTVWRPKRDGGPYRLDLQLPVERAA